MSNHSTSPSSTVIVGGGIIGLSIAYYLSVSQSSTASQSIQIIDSAPNLLLSASGYSGGFLAKDWFSPTASSLGALSFKLHRQLADQNDGRKKWGYSNSTAYSLSIEDVGVASNLGQGKDWLETGVSRANVAQNGTGSRHEMLNDDGTPAWITKQEGGNLEVISSDEGCAQVEPRELCEFLIEEVQKRGVKIHLSSQALELVKTSGGDIEGLKVETADGTTMTLTCNNIVIASGAWSSRVFKTLFPTSRTKVGIRPLAGYSIVVRSPRYNSPIIPLEPSKQGPNAEVTGMCHSVFCASGPHWKYAPEAISRTTKSGKPEIYVAGLNDSNMDLPSSVMEVKSMMDPKMMANLKRTTFLLTGLPGGSDEETTGHDLEVVREGLCLRPVSNKGVPIVARLEERILGEEFKLGDDKGVFMAAGHGTWGISMSLGTGLVMAEMIQKKSLSADISGLGLK